MEQGRARERGSSPEARKKSGGGGSLFARAPTGFRGKNLFNPNNQTSFGRVKQKRRPPRANVNRDDALMLESKDCARARGGGVLRARARAAGGLQKHDRRSVCSGRFRLHSAPGWLSLSLGSLMACLRARSETPSLRLTAARELFGPRGAA